jgi:hypothetical protein
MTGTSGACLAVSGGRCDGSDGRTAIAVKRITLSGSFKTGVARASSQIGGDNGRGAATFITAHVLRLGELAAGDTVWAIESVNGQAFRLISANRLIAAGSRL